MSATTGVRREFLKRFLPIAVLMGVVAFLMVEYQGGVLKKAIIARTTSALSMEKGVLEASLSTYLSDAVFLAEIVEQHLGEHPDDSAFRKELSDEFQSFSEARKVYDQIRFINRAGMEIVRINMTSVGAVAVPMDKLQNKGDRYYFKKGLRSRAEVYVSKFDLNMEGGRVEEPLKPMLRFSTPVYGKKGDIQGVIVLNYLGANLLEHLRRTSRESEELMVLVNPEGFWLMGQKPEDEWGFMFDGGADRSMAARTPGEWQEISSALEGQVEGPSGLSIFKTVFAFRSDEIGGATGFQGEAEESWKIISTVPPELLLPPWRNAAYGAVLCLLIIFGITIHFLVRARVKEEETIAALAENEEKFRTVTDSVRDAIIMIDSRDRVCFWNSAASELFGYRQEEIMGLNLHDSIVPKDLKQKAEEGLARYESTGQGSVFDGLLEFQVIGKDGREFPVELSVSPIIMKGERYATGTVREITERKRAEDAVKELNEELEERVEERTAQFERANEDLRENMAQLERFSDLAHGREVRMIKLKEEVNELLVAKGDKEKYKIVS